jgi:ABC-2 type transport system permease protein
MGVALLIMWKDLRQRVRDKSALLVAVVLPFALIFIFSQILGGTSGRAVILHLAVADEDGGPTARTFVDDVLKPIEASGFILLQEVDSGAEARQLVTDGGFGAAFVIPKGFSDAVTSGQQTTIHVLGNISASLSPVVATSIASAFAGRVTAVQTSIATMAYATGGLDPDEIPELISRASALSDPVTVNDVSAASKELDPSTFYAAGMAVFFLFFTVQCGVIGILDERRDGTLARMLTAPIHRWSVLMGKLLASFTLGVVSMAILAISSSLMFRAEWGNPVGVAILIIASVMSATSVGAVVSTYVRSSDQAGNAQSVIAMTLGALGGSFFPVGLAGGILQKLSLLTPHAWFLQGIGELQSGGGLGDIVGPLAAILAFGAVFGVIAVARQERMVQP